uniref:Uncharacterized protein n=1 Tax=Chelydra serpentina TaxID=8475 RepID=A0A8C3T110_CHESE
MEVTGHPIDIAHSSLELLSDPPTAASQAAGITGICLSKKHFLNLFFKVDAISRLKLIVSPEWILSLCRSHPMSHCGAAWSILKSGLRGIILCIGE